MSGEHGMNFAKWAMGARILWSHEGDRGKSEMSGEVN